MKRAFFISLIIIVTISTAYLLLLQSLLSTSHRNTSYPALPVPPQHATELKSSERQPSTAILSPEAKSEAKIFDDIEVNTLLEPSALNLSVLQVAIVTPLEGPVTDVHRLCSYTKTCYAMSTINSSTRVTFIEDRFNYSLQHGRHPSWNRIPAVRALIATNRYDWILNLDADIAISNAAVNLGEDLLHHVPASWHLVLTDAASGVNSGGFAVRSSSIADTLLQQWWEHGVAESHPLKATYHANDQVALWDFIISIARTASRATPPKVTSELTARESGHKWKPRYQHHYSCVAGSCHKQLEAVAAGADISRSCRCSPLGVMTGGNSDWAAAIGCFTLSMKQSGYPSGARDLPERSHIGLLDPARPLRGAAHRARGFTFFYPNRAAASTWPRSELWQPGDFVIHSRKVKYLKGASTYKEMISTMCNGRLVNSEPTAVPGRT